MTEIKKICPRCKEREKNKSGYCKQCSNVISKKWRQNNKEKVKAYNKNEYAENREKHKARSKAWREKNKEKRKKYAKIWNQNNREKIRKHHTDYRKKIFIKPGSRLGIPLNGIGPS